MAVVNNTFSEIGDSAIICTDGPTTGISAISGYTDDVDGVTGTRLFTKEFRYTTDGINWSEWQDLTNLNLQAISIDPSYDFNIEYRYTRAGTDDTGLLTWNWVNIQATYVASTCGDVFNNSVFSRFLDCCDEDVLNWCINVLEKLYKPGIVSQSLVRGKNQNANNEDRDYIDFWRSITCFFGLIVNYARQFENLEDNQLLLEMYLEARGIYLHNDHTITELQGLMSGFYNIINQRGTRRVGTDGANEGELKRMVSFNPNVDEFLYGITDHRSNGWTLNLHSPLYRGVTNQEALMKAYDQIPGQTVSERYPLLNAGSCALVTEGDDEVLRCTTVLGQKTGIGASPIAADDRIVIDPSLPYQIDFEAKVSDLTAKLSVRVYGFDVSGGTIDPDSVQLISPTNYALEKFTLPKIDEYYHIRVILFPYSHVYVDVPEITKTSMNAGTNLKCFSNINSIFVEVTLDDEGSDSAGNLFIKDYKFGLLNTDYSKSFVGGSEIAETWLKNNSGRYSDNDVDRATRDYLIPYHVGIVNNFI